MKIKIFRAKNGKIYVKREYEGGRSDIFEVNLDIMEISIAKETILIYPKKDRNKKEKKEKEYEYNDKEYEKYNVENYIV